MQKNKIISILQIILKHNYTGKYLEENTWQKNFYFNIDIGKTEFTFPIQLILGSTKQAKRQTSLVSYEIYGVRTQK